MLGNDTMRQKGDFMRFRPWLCGLMLFSSPLMAQDSLVELRELLQTELSHESAQEASESVLQYREGTVSTTKYASMKEILERLDQCRRDEIIGHRTEEADLLTIAFSCRKENSELMSAEVLISQKEGRSQVLRYQEMVLNERIVAPEELSRTILSPKLDLVDVNQNVSPGVRTLLALAKVGVPVALSFKAATVFSPVRTDWQKHFIAGALISGATILTSEGLIRSYNKRNGYQMSDVKINMMTSLAGLVASMGAGVSKELYDKYSGRGHPEVNDALYTAAGGMMVSATVVIPIELIFRSRKQQTGKRF